MKENDQSFLDEGLAVYGEARATLIFFEREVSNIISSALDNRKSWNPLENVNRRFNADRSQGQHGYWINATVVGNMAQKDRLTIECGLWWNAFKNDRSPIVYGGFFETPAGVMRFDWDESHKEIRALEAWNRTYLYIPIANAIKIENSLNVILDELLGRVNAFSKKQ